MKKTRDILTIGFALFAMFFGAGNLLLPPFIGMQVGQHIWITILAFGLTGILLPFFGVLSVTNAGDSFNDLGNRINKNVAAILGTIIMICIGPLIAIPRTAATTYEVGILPSFPTSQPIWTSISFFAVTWLFSIVPSKVVDLVGNILTPLLLLLLIILISIGITQPIDNPDISSLSTMDSFSLGFTEGYQTLDVLASVIFAGIIITATKSKGYTSTSEKNKIVIAAGALAALSLLIIYGGLIYLGATSGINDIEIKRSELLIHISKSLLGKYGTLAIAISIALACLTTAIALTSAFGTFFNQLTQNKVSYKVLVTICCIFSCGLSIGGVDTIIQFAYPPLAFVYPIVITLVLYFVIFGQIIKSKAPYIGALIGSTIVALLGLLKALNLLSEKTLQLLNYIPFFEYDLGWVIPSALLFLIFYIVDKIKT
ncbi:branched-chain amino acid transport system II carrier protein [Sphingobacterium sp. UT-1RO-CII-1]|uniref:branched-chain amino acid transport system II carrier protein n=1 Tax=Sphingobacterium sp. UT-1RO-CII-1 TaxID=2995225 RepID=UPI00227CA73A|nr:branched-chain amino acid transport system II carrier protein [Sphingobacterium sp. UT-1RO-CII-1]MCY4778242.1 branched-chain amino acid transport system II carrier protein [Sphingobacterium sp. UT-1RO-CII-1]